MSFILDALRKSERERQSKRAPGIADTRSPTKEKNRSMWLPLAALLAGLNIALLGLLWYSNNDGNAPVASTASMPQPAANPRMPVSAGMTRSTGSLSDELPLSETVQAEPGFAEPARYAAIAPPGNTVQPTPADIEIPPQPAAAVLPTVTEAMMDGSLSVMPMNLDLHVYSDTPAERFVFINTERYGEGDRMSEGPTIAAITTDGVILNYQGRDFLLARE